MRTYLKILFFLLVSCCSITSYAGNPTACLTYAAFTTSAGQNYFETYLSVAGNSMKYVKNANNKFTAKAHITITFKDGDKVVSSSNFNLVSAELNDTNTKPDFMDVHRFWIDRGNYTLVFTINDPNDPDHAMVSGKQPVHTGYAADSTAISDAEFISSYKESDKNSPYNKNGYEMIPYVFRNYPSQLNKIGFYCEIYNTIKTTGPNQKVLIKYSIEDEGNYFLEYSENFTGNVVMPADTVIPFMAEIPIQNLPSGNYSLLISVIDKNNHMLTKRKFGFTRNNPGVGPARIPGGFAPYFANRDTLIESIKCLGPRANFSEKEITDGDSIRQMPTDELKRFFYFFWASRDTLHPFDAWQKYLASVMQVNHSFSVPGVKGYRTDRGRVYLQYGPPNHRIVSKHNPSTYPYEIWHYYKLPDGQTDMKFIFYDHDLVTNNYTLLHSTAIGETQNSSWQIMLYSRLGTPSNIDISKIQDEMGENVNDEFNDPH